MGVVLSSLKSARSEELYSKHAISTLEDAKWTRFGRKTNLLRAQLPREGRGVR